MIHRSRWLGMGLLLSGCCCIAISIWLIVIFPRHQQQQYATLVQIPVGSAQLFARGALDQPIVFEGLPNQDPSVPLYTTLLLVLPDATIPVATTDYRYEETWLNSPDPTITIIGTITQAPAGRMLKAERIIHGSRHDMIDYLAFQADTAQAILTLMGWGFAVVGIPLAAMGILLLWYVIRGTRAS
jgi:hypothetical protein